jgi:thiamine monophosphate kinase
LIAVPQHRFADLQALAGKLDLGLTAIGGLRAGRGVTWIQNGREFAPTVQGYDHFR